MLRRAQDAGAARAGARGERTAARRIDDHRHADRRHCRAGDGSGARTGVSLAILNDGRSRTQGLRLARRRASAADDGRHGDVGASFHQGRVRAVRDAAGRDQRLDLDRPIEGYLGRPLTDDERYRDLAGRRSPPSLHRADAARSHQRDAELAVVQRRPQARHQVRARHEVRVLRRGHRIAPARRRGDHRRIAARPDGRAGVPPVRNDAERAWCGCPSSRPTTRSLRRHGQSGSATRTATSPTPPARCRHGPRLGKAARRGAAWQRDVAGGARDMLRAADSGSTRRTSFRRTLPRPRPTTTRSSCRTGWAGGC